MTEPSAARPGAGAPAAGVSAAGVSAAGPGIGASAVGPGTGPPPAAGVSAAGASAAGPGVGTPAAGPGVGTPAAGPGVGTPAAGSGGAVRPGGGRTRPEPGVGGLVVVDKPAGWTSHDVVARVRRIARTRRVGHAGTLDPMATGVLVLGVERATKLLGHLALTDKTYQATVRLGQATLTDDAEGEVTGGSSAAGVDPDAVRAGLAALIGEIEQVPSAVSAVKIDGQRAYARVRAGESVELAARPVTVSRLELVGSRRPAPDLLDLDVEVDCSSGTYVRALARDLGAALGVGGHLTALRRTRVGPFTLADALTLEQLAERADPVPVPLDAAVAAAFPRRDLDPEVAARLAHGGRLEPVGIPGPYGAFGPDGAVVALVEESAGVARPLVVFRPAG